MPTRSASAKWEGGLKGGKGTFTGQTGLGGQYNFSSRFENGAGSNPEELLAAAHAGCYSMALSFMLQNAGFTANRIDTRADVQMETSPGPHAAGVHLTVTASVPGIDAATFAGIADNAKANCVISRALSIPVTLDAKLA